MRLDQHSRTVDVQIERGPSGPQLVLRPRMEFCRIWPSASVTIDPAANLTATLDTFVNKSKPAVSYNSDQELKVGRLGADPNNVFRSFLKFDHLADRRAHRLLGNAVPAGRNDGSFH